MIQPVGSGSLDTGTIGAPGGAGNTAGEFSRALEHAGAKTSLDEIFDRAGARYGVPVPLLKAIGKAESGFNPGAVSRSGAQGVMQLMPATARSLGVTDAFDPEQNIMGGAKYIAQMLDQFGGDTELALAAYNAGPGSVRKYGGIPPFRETQNYVKNVLSYMGGDLATPDTPLRAGATEGGGLDALQGELALMALSRLFDQMTRDDEDEGRKIF